MVGSLVAPMTSAPPILITPGVNVPVVSRLAAPSAVKEPRSSVPPPVLSISIAPPVISRPSFEVTDVVVMLPVACRITSPSVALTAPTSITPALMSRLPSVASIARPLTVPVASISMMSASTLPVKVTVVAVVVPPMVRSLSVVIVLVVIRPLVSSAMSPSDDSAPRSSVPPPVLSTSINPLVAPGSFDVIDVVVMLPAAVRMAPPLPLVSMTPAVIVVPALALTFPSDDVRSRTPIAPVASISRSDPEMLAVAVRSPFEFRTTSPVLENSPPISTVTLDGPDASNAIPVSVGTAVVAVTVASMSRSAPTTPAAVNIANSADAPWMVPSIVCAATVVPPFTV